MRVLIKLFDREPIKNVLSVAVFSPEIVVYLCDQRGGNVFKESAIYRFFRHRGLRTRPRFYYLDAWSPLAVSKALYAVIRDYPGCVFDFTGGKDVMLVMAGMTSADLDLPAFHIDIHRRRFSNIRHCERLIQNFKMPVFLAEDLLAVTGATISGYGHITPKQFGGGFEDDVRTVFSILMKNTKTWGEFVSYLQVCCAHSDPDMLTAGGAKTMNGERQLVCYNPDLMEQLLAKGLFTQYELAGKGVVFTFKNPLVKKCLLSVGVWLELYCYIEAKETGFFNEVISSVIIDWDGANGKQDTAKNEVDMLLVKGITPVFVSCKMGMPSALALYEVKQLSDKFAGSFGRAAMVTAQRLGKESAALRNRAQELRILILDRGDIESGSLGKKLIGLASNPAPKPLTPPLNIPKDRKVW